MAQKKLKKTLRDLRKRYESDPSPALAAEIERNSTDLQQARLRQREFRKSNKESQPGQNHSLVNQDRSVKRAAWIVATCEKACNKDKMSMQQVDKTLRRLRLKKRHLEKTRSEALKSSSKIHPDSDHVLEQLNNVHAKLTTIKNSMSKAHGRQMTFDDDIQQVDKRLRKLRLQRRNLEKMRLEALKVSSKIPTDSDHLLEQLNNAQARIDTLKKSMSDIQGRQMTFDNNMQEIGILDESKALMGNPSNPKTQGAVDEHQVTHDDKVEGKAGEMDCSYDDTMDDKMSDTMSAHIPVKSTLNIAPTVAHQQEPVSSWQMSLPVRPRPM